MGLFEYLGVLISVVMGLGITHLLTGTSKVIQHRETVRIYWVHTLWTLNVLIYILVIWWGMFWWSKLDEWAIFEFLFVTLYAIVLFLQAAMLYPWDLPATFDFKEYFFKNRGWFFGLHAAGWCIDIAETMSKAQMGLRDLPAHYLAFAVFMVALGVFGAVTRSHRLHTIYAPLWLVTVLIYLGSTTLSRIAT
jgi:hypothetical protein